MITGMVETTILWYILKRNIDYIEVFYNFYQSSNLFRYSFNKSMGPYFIEEKKFDIENVSSCFEELCNFLDGVDSMLSEIKDYEAEMASYYYDY